MIRKVASYFADGTLTMDKMATVSRAGAGLLQWVIAIKGERALLAETQP